MSFWLASSQQGGRDKPGDAPLACQRSTGGHAKPRDVPLSGQRSTGGSHQAWRCLSCGPALHRGAPSPAMPLWWASARQVGRRMQAAAPMAETGGDGGGLADPQAIWPLSLGESPAHRVEAGNVQRNFAQGRRLVLSACLACRQQMSWHYGHNRFNTFWQLAPLKVPI